MREARAAAGLHHPNIVPIHDAGQLGDHYYIASAYIEGGTLRDILQSQGCPSHVTAARLVARLADALGYAHSMGIVHRDVKPENVLLDSKGTPYLTDFGLARRLEDDQPTQRRSLFGTPGYMSPEQAAGKVSESAGPSDQWALGVLLYELLTGRRPFEGEPVQVLYAVQHTEPEPPRAHVPTLSLDLQAICLKCLAKAPEQRYADCFELAADLQRWLDDEPVHARPMTLPQRLVRWHRREPWIVRLVALFMLSITCFSVGLILLWLRAESLRTVADKSFAEAEESLKMATQAELKLQTTNAELQAERDRLENKNRQLDQTIRDRDKTVDALEQSRAALLKSQQATSAAEEDATKAKLQSAAEQAKSRKMRYFGDIHAAGLAITAGQADRALSMLTDTNPAERSVEWNYLSNLADSIDHRFELVVDKLKLTSEQTTSILSRHFPSAAADEPHIRALRSAKGVLTFSEDARRWLFARGTSEILKKHLPPGTHQPRDERYPNGPEFKAIDLVATEFGKKAILAEADVTHAWLSPDGRYVGFMEPKVTKTTISELDLVLTIRFELKLVDLNATSEQSIQLIQPNTTFYDLKIRLIVTPGAKDAYRVDIPNMPTQFCGAFSPDSKRFVLYNGQASNVCSWDVDAWSPSESKRQPRVSASVPAAASATAACAMHHNTAEIQLGIPGHLLELEADTLTVQNDRQLPAEDAVLSAIVFTRSGRHVAQVYSKTDIRGATKLLLQLNNCLADISQTIDIPPQRLAFCSEYSKSLSKLSESGATGPLMLDQATASFVDDADGDWLSMRLPNGIYFVFEKPQRTLTQAETLWTATTKRAPVLLKSSPKDDTILIAFEDRVAIMKQDAQRDKWHLATNREIKNGGLVDAELHSTQESVLVCQGKQLAIYANSSNAKPREFPLPYRGSLAQVSERTLAFINARGMLQLASPTDGTLGNALAVHRAGSSCLAVDPARQLVAIANSERTLTVVDISKLTSTASAVTREVPQRLILNSQADLLCSVGSDSRVSLYAWPKLQRIATFDVTESVLYATASNDKRRLLVVTPTGFQILDNEFAVPVLNTQKFDVPAVAAKVTSDQGAIFVYNQSGQLLRVKL